MISAALPHPFCGRYRNAYWTVPGRYDTSNDGKVRP
jgi:hypothetical protein